MAEYELRGMDGGLLVLASGVSAAPLRQGIIEPEKRGEYASDWPHHDFDHPSRILNYPMPEEVKRQVMGENAAQFLFTVWLPC